MKKSLIALAVASAFAAPAFAATGNVDVYGKVRVSLSAVEGEWGMADQASRIGFKGSEDLGGGLKALWQIESSFNAAGETENVDTDRNTFIGLSGGFGTVVVGRHDTPYKLAGSADLFGDTVADSQGSSTGVIGRNSFDLRVDTAIAYISPDFSGFHFAVATVTDNSYDDDGDDLNMATSIAGIYANGPLKVTAAFEDHDGGESSWKLNGAYTMGDLTLGATYENQEDHDNNWLVSAAYGMGPITLAAQYGSVDMGMDARSDGDRWVVGAIYALSKRTNVAVAYMSDDNIMASGADIDGFTIQMNHDF
jgi:predicted porin